MKNGVIIELDKPRTLRYGINAMIVVEDMVGVPITKLDLESISMKDLRSIMYAGLVHEDKSLTPESVGGLIDEYSNIEIMAEKLGEAFELAFGGDDKKNGKKPRQKILKPTAKATLTRIT